MREVRMDRLWNEADLLDVLGPTYRADAAELAATYRWAAAEVERLTAELAEADKLLRVHEATDDARLAAAEASEKALLAITGQMLDGKDYKFWSDEEAAGFESACNEWDRRAGEVT